MPSESRRLHGFTVVSQTLRLARQLILPAILGGASIGGDLAGSVLWILLILSLPSLVLATAQWIVFRFGIEGNDLVIDSGVLLRRRRVIPLDRVQNVDLAQSAMERLAGVAELRIETASGGQETEASLTVLSIADARAVQAELLARRASARRAAAADGGEALAPPPDRVLLRLSPLDLAVAGATANEAGLIAAGLATMLELVGRVGALERTADWIDDAFDIGAGLGVVGAAGLIVLVALGFLVLGWLVSIVATVVRFHGFTLTRIGDDLKREYGLFSRHQSTVPLERVQAARVEETLLRRAFGLAAVKVETAGAGPRDRRGGGRAETYVPIARRADVGRLLREVFQDARFEGVALEAVAPASRRRELARIEIGILAVVAALTAFLGRELLAALLLLGPGWLLASARYRARGWARADGYVLARDGVLTRMTWIVPERKIQTLHLNETPFQRRWDLGTLRIDTAGRGRDARVVDLHTTTARHLLNSLAGGPDAGHAETAAAP
jgi:putative membrane protein